ncbi:MAG TPA: M1 family metallopeptidase [Gemmatimonadales bacterium]|nr:M1 family metallopeptidase [Gemmatimonadales bacterium]
MRRPFFGSIAVLAAATVPAIASAQMPRFAAGEASIFRPLDLPTPNAYRAASGAPGPLYWQQRVNYRIEATLDTVTKSVSGRETVDYVNNSPDTLHFVWMQVDQNIYRPHSLGSELFPSGARFAGGGFAGGDSLAAVTVNGTPVTPFVNDTRMRLDLPHPLAPHDSLAIGVTWSFPVPEHGSDRMGRDGSLYEIAQWYPRMAVYDDVSGWNTDPYLGQGEFYLEYGDFDVSLTVPAGYIVAATGTLENPSEVLTATERARLATAAHSTKAVAIIGTREAGMPIARPRTSGTMTWHFDATNTRDFSWAAAPNFRWDALTEGGTTCHAFYRNQDTAWTAAAEMTCYSIHDYSTRWFPYPYGQATSVAGPVGGMEYPMIVFVSGQGDARGLFGTITHEIGHEWFPMTVGSNERHYAWMDEGFNTFMNTWTIDDRFPGSDQPSFYQRMYDFYTRLGGNQPMMTWPDKILPQGLGVVAYEKPAMVLLMLRNDVLGPKLFDSAFRTYIRRWAFKHPQPADFFRTMEDVSGEHLEWFFREWFYTDDTLDQSIDSVRVDSTASGFRTAITLRTKAPTVMPVDLEVTFADSTTQEIHLPVDIWFYGPTYIESMTLPKRPVAMLIDPKMDLPDQDRSNNGWNAGGS